MWLYPVGEVEHEGGGDGLVQGVPQDSSEGHRGRGRGVHVSHFVPGVGVYGGRYREPGVHDDQFGNGISTCSNMGGGALNGLVSPGPH